MTIKPTANGHQSISRFITSGLSDDTDVGPVSQNEPPMTTLSLFSELGE